MARVRIGTCTGPADAALVRSAFDAHQIPVLINAEHHASMLGGLGGAFVPLHIFVDDEYAEEAADLLRDLREHDHTNAAKDDAAAPAEESEEDEDDAELAAVESARSNRRRRIGVMLLISFGGALAVPFVIDQPILGVLLAVVFVGLLASTMRRSPPPKHPLPRARVTSDLKK